MKTILLASVVLGLTASPALAQGKSQGKSHGGHASMKHGGGKAMAVDQRGRSSLSTRVDRNRNGIADRRERGFVDRDRDGFDDRFVNRDANRYGANSCPPGLAKKGNGCMPPGQAKRLFSEGQRVPGGYNYYTDYSRIPQAYRDQYNLDPANRYIYRDDNLYVVDPRTRLVEQVIGGLLGR